MILYFEIKFIFIGFLKCSLLFRAQFFAECHVPLNVVENDAFVEMMKIACPYYKVPSRSTLRNVIAEEAQEVKEMVCLCWLCFFSFFPSLLIS